MVAGDAFAQWGLETVKPRTAPTDASQLRLDQELLQTILEGTATEIGEDFFAALVRNVAAALDTRGAWVTEYLPARRELRALAFWFDGDYVEGYRYAIDGTPCEPVIDRAEMLHVPDRVVELYPNDSDLRPLGAVSYIGVPLQDVDGRILGHLAALDSRVMPAEPPVLAVFRIFAERAAAELRRMRVEEAVREREARLTGLEQAAMDAIIELDRALRITRINPAGERVLGAAADRLVGRDVRQHLAQNDRRRLEELVAGLEQRALERSSIWVPHGLQAIDIRGRSFQAEATLTRFDLRDDARFSLILRDVDEKLAAMRAIETLTREKEYLEQEIENRHVFGDVIGRSPALVRVLRDVDQVAPTDATVLIQGETGTGKELFARAIHRASGRAERPFVKVNCAAIPANLIESELFGHEKGAFTGATQKRVGRFELADGGTIFLDEIGELQLDLQAKLLRVLQEREFEPVGSSRSRRVDVRVVAATNRDLIRAVEAAEFRSDLFYRLNVFPIALPPLRERSEDIPLLAESFLMRFPAGMGRSIAPLSPDDIARLQSYPWPGNVRELENVVERAVITARNGRIDLGRALPCGRTEAPAADIATDDRAETGRILTIRELRDLEKSNLQRALESSGWRVSGPRGAAHLLGMNPSTLSSRMRALGLARPNGS